MYKKNISTVILLGFQNMDYKGLFFILFFIIYCVTLVVNFLIIILVSCSKNLQSPMYFFITQLSISDIMLTTEIVPNMLHVVLNNGATISFTGCITQFFFLGLTETFECLLLTVMSYDRYLAICKPLHYNNVMNQIFCFTLIILCWLLSFSIILVMCLVTSQLEFCGPNIIDHFFCDFYPILELSCSDISILQMISPLMGISDIIIPFIIIIVSYTYIVLIISKISTLSGRWRSFSTCSSHLTVVVVFYGTLIATYLLPSKGHLLLGSKIMSLFYTVVTPFLNPFIYCLRNKDIKEALLQLKLYYSYLEK